VFIASYLIPSFREENGEKLLVFSNCEEIELYINDKFVMKQMPNRVDFPSLPYPPFEFSLNQLGVNYMDMAIKANDVSITAVGLINGKEVARHTLRTYGKPDKLILSCDDNEIMADGSDCTRVVISVVDENGSILPYANIPVSFEIEGEGKLIGENPLALEAGRGAVYVKSKRKTGKITLKAKSPYVCDESKIELKTKDVDYLFL
jgi:beta-galactosidase